MKLLVSRRETKSFILMEQKVNLLHDYAWIYWFFFNLVEKDSDR